MGTPCCSRFPCEGTTCTGLGITLDLTSTLLTDLIDPDIDISIAEANLQSREDGFDTAFIRGDVDPSDIGVLLPDITLSEIPEGLGYGLWGRHGMAGLVVADGPFSGRVADIPFNGNMDVAVPFAFGDVSGTNPDGSGRATWSGIAEVVATRTFRRQEGIATLTIADLAQPAVSVGIEVGGQSDRQVRMDGHASRRRPFHGRERWRQLRGREFSRR